MQLKQGDFCPLVQSECKQLECTWFVKVAGTNPNTGAEIEEYGCAVAWMPLLLIENAKETRQTGAAVESFRNQIHTDGGSAFAMLAGAMQGRLKGQ